MTGSTIKMMRVWVGVLLLAGGACGTNVAQGQDVAGCTMQKGVSTCRWSDFRQVLAAAHTVSVPPNPRDQFTETQLRKLVGDLGKVVSGPEQKADLLVDVVAVGDDGVVVGPGDQPLAVLRVFDTRNGARKLVWAEIFTGQPDRPWASDVRAVINQFQARFGKS